MQLTANASHTFVWGYSGSAVSIDTADAFLIFPNYTGETGRTGIGTSTPQSKLHVVGTIMATAFAGDGSQIVNVPATGGVTGGNITIADTGGTIYAGSTTVATFTAIGSTTVSGNLTVDTNTLYVDAVNDMVGIGTTTPSSILTVAGTATVTGNLAVDTNTLFVDAANNRVGIGTTTPSEALTVNGAFLRAGSTMISSNSHTHINLGITSTTGSTISNYSYITVGGGVDNTASHNYATVGGGWGNIASHSCAAVGGGINNTASGDTATIAGGWLNTASGTYTTVGGGRDNTASNAYATVAGGRGNIASESCTTVGGGIYNTASGDTATIGGGWQNMASGNYATVGGGSQNTAGGSYSWAGGRYMQLSASASNTFVWGYAGSAVSIDTADAFLIFPNYTGATGKVGIGTSTPTRKLSVNGDAGGTSAWNNDSDERLKKNIMPIERALEKVTGLQGVQFEWIDTTNHEEGRRIGFIAQQVKDIIPEVVDKKGEYYSMQYAPITALLVEAIKEMKAENDALKARISALEQCRVGIAHQITNSTCFHGN